MTNSFGSDRMGIAAGGSKLPQVTSVRAINRARVISALRRHPGLTRSRLSRQTGLSKGTITNLVTELLSEGFLYEEHGSTQRRRNTGLWLNKNAGLAMGMELSPYECRGVLTNVSMEPLKRVQHPLKLTRVEESIDVISSVASELRSGCGGRVLGLTVAVPGPTDARGRTVVFSESMGWSDVPLAERLTERLSCPVTVVNRPRAGVLGEYWHGAGVGVDDLIYVSISSGVSVGILIGGQLFGGAFGYGGEFGHTTMLIDGPECVCGNRGCLEALTSIPAIMRSIQVRIHGGETSAMDWPAGYQDLIAAARDGDALVLEEIRTASRYVGIGVANLIDLFNPRLVIIGGQLAQAGEIVLNTVRETAQRRAFPLSFSGVRIVRNALGADSVCIGACALVVDQYVAQVEPAVRSGARWLAPRE